jgi:D-lactate dehydrogenase
MKVAVFETEQWEHRACQRLEPEFQVVCTHDPLTVDTVSKYTDSEIISSFINSTLSSAVLMRLPKLKFIATRSTGYDHIDLAYCRSRGIIVSNVPDYGDSTVAEHAFALLLAIARHLVEAVDRTRRGNFSQSDLRGFELRNKTLGVIGTGRIGRRVIEIANGFGMTVVAFDLAPDEPEAKRLGFRYLNLDAVLASADVLTLHVPATAETVGLLSERAFGLMKPGAVVINTARGNVIDIAAMVRALAEGRLLAVGLDVLPQESLIREEAQIFRGNLTPRAADLKALVANHVLLRFPNVIVTPHNAYNTDSALQRIIDTSLSNIEAYGRGEQINAV